MTAAYTAVFFLAAALLFALICCTSRSAERLLWGSVLCSLGLGLAVQVSEGTYFGLLMAGSFLVTDLSVYLYFRTQNLVTKREPKNPRADRAYRAFFIWLASCFVVAVSAVFLTDTILFTQAAELASGGGTIYDRVWGTEWLLILIPTLSLLPLVIGGFLLVRKE